MSREVNATRQWHLVSSQNTIRETFFFKNYAEVKARKLVSDLFLSFKENLYEVKASVLQLSLKYKTFGY